ncbi:MAG: TonB family protein [Verrucomicrobiota bacterium]
MSSEYPSARWKWTPLVTIAGASMLAALLFVLIPLTQLSETEKTLDLQIREVVFSPPPPEAPPPPEEATPPAPEIPPPEMASEPPAIQIEALDIALNPGAGDAVAIGVETPQFQSEDMTTGIQELFTFDDLPEAPRLINQPRFRFPPGLVQRGVSKGRVIVEIDVLPDGRARLQRIVSSTHAELEATARQVIEGARFTKPEVDGRPQTVRGRFPITLEN